MKFWVLSIPLLFLISSCEENRTFEHLVKNGDKITYVYQVKEKLINEDLNAKTKMVEWKVLSGREPRQKEPNQYDHLAGIKLKMLLVDGEIKEIQNWKSAAKKMKKIYKEKAYQLLEDTKKRRNRPVNRSPYSVLVAEMEEKLSSEETFVQHIKELMAL
ncbi:MAG: hypothetical protein AAFX87_16560 [Bacteroidota bacterium]